MRMRAYHTSKPQRPKTAHYFLPVSVPAQRPGTCPKGSAEVVAAAIRTTFAQPTGAEVIDQLDKVAAMLAPKFPAVAVMLIDAREDLTAFASFPTSHWVKTWSTNPLERVNKRSSAGPTWSASS